MRSHFLYLFACCLSIGQLTVKADLSSCVNRLLSIQNELQRLQADVSSSLKALQSPRNEKMITVESSTINRDFQFLKQQLADFIQSPENLNQMQRDGSLNQLSLDTIEYIKAHRFDEAQDKLMETKNLEEIPKVIGAVYDNDPNNFELLAEFIESLSDINLIYASVSALHKEMVENDHFDPLKFIRLAKVLETRLLIHPVDYFQTEFARFTYNALKEAIIDSTLDVLDAAVSKGELNGDEEMNNLTAAVYLYDQELWEKIIYEFVNTNIDKNSKVLEVINSQKFIEQRVTGVSTFYWLMKFNHNPDSDLIIRIASILRELQSDRKYLGLNNSLKDLVDKIIENLPTCAKNLFFLTSACLWNRGAEAYLTAVNSSLKHDSKPHRQRILSTDLLPGSHWEFQKVENYFLISNKAFENELLFAANTKHSPKFRHVFNRITKSRTKIDDRTKWLVELDNDYCYLKSSKFNEYLITSNFYFDNNSRYVFTWVPEVFSGEPQFQWQIKDCE